MKYVLTGSLGNISQPVASQLVAAGHTVTVITSNPAKVADIEALGATAAVGSIEDTAFLNSAFAGADAVYTMVPPKWDAAEWKKYIASIGKNYAAAITAAGVKYVVNLSSIGADMPDGCGPVTGLHHVENALNALAGVNVKHVRPGYFYNNFLANIGMVKNAGIIGGNYGAKAVGVFSDTNDIADTVAEELLALSFTGHSVRYTASDVRSFEEAAAAIGTAVGNPALPWVEFTDEQSVGGMQQAGLSEEVAKNYTEMGSALRSGQMVADFLANRPAVLGKVKLEDFAQRFATAYNA